MMNLRKRKQASYDYRIAAAKRAFDRPTVQHQSNGDEQTFDETYALSFTKGMKHNDKSGLLENVGDGKQFRAAIFSGFVSGFEKIPSGVTNVSDRRKWEAPTAGSVFDLEGPDAQAVTMAPAPGLGTDELVYEMAEVYALAAIRDVSFRAFDARPHPTPGLQPDANDQQLLGQTLDLLNQVQQSGSVKSNRRDIGVVSPGLAFRGSSAGVENGQYLSQFFHVGNVALHNGQASDEGRINFGAAAVDLKVSIAQQEDFMTNKTKWLEVQNGKKQDREKYVVNQTRFITTPRDLATYVHYDALYEAYLNACLCLLAVKAPFDLAFQSLHNGNNVTGFALWGGPHILTLVTEVATRALKAVRYQKYNIHLRLRPEALAGRLALLEEIRKHPNGQQNNLAGKLGEMKKKLADIANHATANAKPTGGPAREPYFLPMAFPEGSPMHPSYGAGHATVAGACVTVLKAFFDTDTYMVSDPNTEFTFAKNDPSKNHENVEYFANGTQQTRSVGGDHRIKLEHELNKLAANVSIGRNMAGVHYYSDYYDSLRMGEKIAIGILEEQAILYPNDEFAMNLITFDGVPKKILRSGVANV